MDCQITYTLDNGSTQSCLMQVTDPPPVLGAGPSGTQAAAVPMSMPMSTGLYYFHFVLDRTSCGDNTHSSGYSNLDSLKDAAKGFLDSLNGRDLDGDNDTTDIAFNTLSGMSYNNWTGRATSDTALETLISGLSTKSSTAESDLLDILTWTWPNTSTSFDQTTWGSQGSAANNPKVFALFLCSPVTGSAATAIQNIKNHLRIDGGAMGAGVEPAYIAVFSMTNDVSHAALASPGMYYDLS